MEIALLLIKVLLTAFSIILIPTYWKYYGFRNFLFLSICCLNIDLIH